VNKFEKLLIIAPALADAGPLVYYIFIARLWRGVPLVIALVCTFAPLLVGVATLITLLALRHRKIIPRRSDSSIIGMILAVVGILELFFFY
jgi:hypothetical protein